jgi:hypothetical protein
MSCARVGFGWGLKGSIAASNGPAELRGNLMKLVRLALAACVVWVMPTTASTATQADANRSPQLVRQHRNFDASGTSQYCAAEFYYCSEKSVLSRWCRLLRLEPVATLQLLALDLVGRAQAARARLVAENWIPQTTRVRR